MPGAEAARPAAGPWTVLAVDQGTSATKALLVDQKGAIVARAAVPVGQQHPQPGWEEQDAEEIWASVHTAVARCLRGHDPSRVAALGLSTQRESTLMWERATGRPAGPLLSWQDGRAGPLCARLRADGEGERVQALSGLPLDPMFSASKASWLLDTYDPDRRRSRAGELCLGTVDSWLLWRLGGEHLIEVGNAARTQLLNLAHRTWDPWLLEVFQIPAAVLPRVVVSTGPFPPGALAATAAADSGGVYLVPAFTGLGAPWWDDTAAALLTGFTFGTRTGHLARAALESIAFQVEDVIAAVERAAGPIQAVLADGGPAGNPALMQLQADISGRQVSRALDRDLSALGAAHLAGLGAGLWSLHDLDTLERAYESYQPAEPPADRAAQQVGWHRAVACARGHPVGQHSGPGKGEQK